MSLGFMNVRREGNNIAYSLTKYAVLISDFLVWMEDVSPQISAVIQADSAGFS